MDEVIELFRDNRMSCLASGCVDKLVKFFFYAEMVRSSGFFEKRMRSLNLYNACSLTLFVRLAADRDSVCVLFRNINRFGHWCFGRYC